MLAEDGVSPEQDRVPVGRALAVGRRGQTDVGHPRAAAHSVHPSPAGGDNPGYLGESGTRVSSCVLLC